MGITIPKVESAHAILRLSDKYILQLRDDNPIIISPGQWSLFGGKIDSGETPLGAMRRELFEELRIKPKVVKFLWQTDHYLDFVNGIVRTWFFTSCVDDVWSNHDLKEGLDTGLFSFYELKNLGMPYIMRQALKRYELVVGKREGVSSRRMRNGKK